MNTYRISLALMVIFTSLLTVMSALTGYADERVVRVGIYTNPPIVYQDDEGMPGGLSIEVLKYAGAEEGWRLEYVHGTWAECLERLERGENDIQVAMAFSKERLNSFDFTEETIFNNWAQIYSQQGTTYETILDLHQKRIALLKSGIHTTVLKELANSFGIEPVFVEVEDYIVGLRLLHEKKVDAAQINRVLAATNADKYNVQKTPIIYNPIELKYGAKKGQNTELLAAIDRHLRELKADRTSVYHRYIDTAFGTIGRRGGVPRWVRWVLASGGGIVFIFVLVTVTQRYRIRQKTKEIVERKKVEERIRESEKKFRDLMENLQIGIAVTTLEGRIIETNQYFMNMMGYDSREEFTKIPAQQLYDDPKDRERFLEFLCRNTGKNFDVRLKKKDGSVIWVDIYSVSKIVGTETQLINAVADITDRKLIEEALSESEAHFRSLVENIQGAVYRCVMDSSWTMLFLSDTIEDIAGYPSSDFIDNKVRSFGSIIHPDDRDKVNYVIHDNVSNNKPFEIEYRVIDANGKIHWVYERGQGVYPSEGNMLWLDGVIFDITEHKQTEELLKESERKYRTLFEKMLDGFAFHKIVTDDDGRPVDYIFLEVNAAFEKLTGLLRDKIVGNRVTEVLPGIEKDSIDWIGIYGNVALTGEETRFESYAEPLDMWYNISAYCPAKGFFSVIFENITERKKAEESLKISEKKFRDLMENLQIGIAVTTPEGRIIETNQYFMNMMGYDSREEFIKIPAQQLYDDPKDRERFLEFLDRKTGKNFEARMKRKDGTLIWNDLYSVSRLVGTENHLINAVADITERKKMENEIRNSLSEKEMLIKEIHHRVKNNLIVIQSLLKLQSVQIKDKESKEYFDESQNRIRSMSLIHERLYRSHDLSSVLFSEYVRSLAKQLFRSYKISTSLVELVIEVPDVNIDIEMMIPCGLIMNELISNSLKYAFPEGRKGTLRIELTVSDKNEYTLVVKDNGVGISGDINIFETESLGMQIVTSLISQINGSVELIRNKGTEFRITFKEKEFGP